MSFHVFARYWLVTFLICAVVGAFALRPANALSLYVKLRDVAPAGHPLSNRALALEAQGALGSTEPGTEAPNFSQVQTLQEVIKRQRKEAEWHLVIFAGVVLVVPTLVSLIPFAAIRWRHNAARLRRAKLRVGA